jgi:hypothetical protein
VSARICLIANFSVPWSTGSDLRRTLEGMGVEVWAFQEENLAGWSALLTAVKAKAGVDAVIWNVTPSLSARIPRELHREVQFRARTAGIPTIGFHLDRWWGLQRQADVYTHAFFQSEWVFTADGHPQPWKEAGVNHEWLPPAVAPFHIGRGHPLPQYQASITFVGSWRRYGHHEWSHRERLVRFLRTTYGPAVTLWPEQPNRPLRGGDLASLYASVDIVVGDSCLVPDDDGRPYTRFWSDRIPETLGRGGFLIHPWVEGLDDRYVVTWALEDWNGLKDRIDHYNSHPDEARARADAGMAYVAAWHTYDDRMFHVLAKALGSRVFDLGVHLWESTDDARRRLDGEADDETPQADAQEPVRAARKKGVPDARQGPRPERQGARQPDVQAGAAEQVVAGPDQRKGQPDPGEGPQPQPVKV